MRRCKSVRIGHVLALECFLARAAARARSFSLWLPRVCNRRHQTRTDRHTGTRNSVNRTHRLAYKPDYLAFLPSRRKRATFQTSVQCCSLPRASDRSHHRHAPETHQFPQSKYVYSFCPTQSCPSTQRHTLIAALRVLSSSEPLGASLHSPPFTCVALRFVMGLLPSQPVRDSPPIESSKLPTYAVGAVLQGGDVDSPWQLGRVVEATFHGSAVVVKRCGRSEAWIYATLLGCDFVPRTHALWSFLHVPGRNDVVMEQLSGSLHRLRSELPFSKVARIASHAVVGLQALYNRCNRVHGDVAPSNMCVRDLRGPAESGVLIDFGAAFYSVTGASPTWQLAGGPARAAFASIAQHDRRTNSAHPSPADDFEALLYCVAWGWLGTLPWEPLCVQLELTWKLVHDPDAAESDSEQRVAYEQQCAALEKEIRARKATFVDQLCDGTSTDPTVSRIPCHLAASLGALFRYVFALPRTGFPIEDAGTALRVGLESISTKAQELECVATKSEMQPRKNSSLCEGETATCFVQPTERCSSCCGSGSSRSA